MIDPNVVDFAGGKEDHRSRREAEFARVRDRYVSFVVTESGIDQSAAERVVAALFDHTYPDGRRCSCGCHSHGVAGR